MPALLHRCRGIVLRASSAAVLSALGLCGSTLAQNAAGGGCTVKRPCIVLGCENKIRGRAWKDSRLNFGVNNLVSQAIYDAGIVSLVEEKPEIREKLTALASELWNRGQKKVLADAKALADTSIVVIGRLVYCGVPRTDVSIGPVHMTRSQTEVRAEVDMILPDGKKLTGSGKGATSKLVVSAAFEYRDDQVIFEQSEVGLALREALTNAVSTLVVGYKRRFCGAP